MAVGLALAVAALAAASLRLPGLLAPLLAAYLVLVADLGLVTWALSPFHAVTAAGLLVAEAILLVAAAGVWWLRGRPGIELAGARGAIRTVAGDPLTVLFLAVVCVALGYELLLVLTTQPTNWDSLTYHLSRVAAWHQYHGIHWIPNAPTGRMNEFQPLAEQEILFLFVATGSTALFALPQYIALLVIIAAVYGAARRLGFGARAAACGAALLATFSLIALEATTAQNDLVAASFPIVAACLLLGGGAVEAVLAGVAVALGLGVKLTTALTLPVILWLAWSGGRRTVARVAAGGALGLFLVSAWGYVLNLLNTGHVLGYGQGRVENTTSFSVTGTVRTALHLVYRLVDLSVFPYWLVAALAVAGVAVGAAAAIHARRVAAAVFALPLIAPALVLGVLAAITGHDPVYIQRGANEDYSGFGPIGTVFLFGAPVLAVASYRARRADVRQLALALALPSFIVLLALQAKYNFWITRFLVVPVVLTAPLFAGIFRKRIVVAAVLAVAGTTVGLVLAHDATKRLNAHAGRPWALSQVEALRGFPAEPTGKMIAASLAAYNRSVPDGACVGAVLGPDEPAYLLWGSGLRRRVFFLPSLAALASAYQRNVDYVVISTGANAPVAKQFTGGRWTVRPLGTYWLLAVAPSAGRGPTCSAW